MTDNPQAETTLVEGPQTVSHNANELRRKLATAERIRENADFHLGQEMARRQLAEKETARLRAELAATPASTAPLAAGFPLVQGRCPACGSAGLFLGSGGYVTCSSADCPEPDAATTVLEQYANEAQPPQHRWYVETRDGVADQWAPGSRILDRHHAVERYEALNENHPTWKDGTPVERRIVRETTTYTVEQPTP